NLFSLHAKEDNFILNKRISDINRKLTNATITSKTQGWYSQVGYAAPIKGRDIIKKAFIGVLSPINSDVCRSSTLNFANLNAENAVTINPKYGRYTLSVDASNNLYNTAPGKKPKLITSAKESNSFPISDLTCSSRAIIPSKKSNIPEARTQ